MSEKLFTQLHSQELRLKALEQLVVDFRSWESSCTYCRNEPKSYYCQVCDTAVLQMHLAADLIEERLKVSHAVPREEHE